MNDTKIHKPPQAVYRHRDFSWIWVVPLLAFIVVGWMGWSNWHDNGPNIHITFEKADGVEANRTQIKHKGVVLGIVKGLKPSDDFSRVEVNAHMSALANPYMNAGAQFWIVRPRISVGAISDLNTLVSGVYIELSPGEGDSTDTFTGLEQPATVDQHEAGKSFILHSPQLSSLEHGSPLYFRGLQVGEVTNFELGADKDIMIHIFIHAPYDVLVMEQTRFWNASGIGITAGPEGIRIAAQSLQAVVQGGITFDVPDGIKSSGTVAQANATFLLYDNRDIAFDSIYTKTIDYRLRFTGSVQGLEAGAAVELLGNRIGRVTQTRIDIDEKNGAATSEVKIELQPERMHLIDGDSKDGSIEDRARAVLALMVKHKLRAQVASGNLLTGQKNINMDFDDDATPAAITGNGDYPEFPTAPPDDIDGLIRDAHVVLEDTDKTIREVGPAIQPLMNSLKTTSDQINTNDGHGGLSGTLYELKQAAQSMRALADYLDAHPEAILRGKKESDK